MNHRIAEFVKSYFDILFPINKIFHPSEKRLIEFANELCELLPVDFEKDLRNLFISNGNNETPIIACKLLHNLNDLINKHCC